MVGGGVDARRRGQCRYVSLCPDIDGPPNEQPSGGTAVTRRWVVLAVVAALAVAGIVVATARFLGSGDNLSGFTQRVVATGLADPYEIVWGPDGFLWATEKSGKKVSRIDPRTGTKHTALDLPDAVHTGPSGQDGVLGLAFLPGDNVVYISYTYDADPATEALERRLKIVRYAY